MKILLEMRPAFEGHSGIPLETRLLFRALAGLPEIEISGLLQSSNLVVEAGLRSARSDSQAEAINQLSRVVVSLQQGAVSHKIEHWRRRAWTYVGPLGAALAAPFGVKTALTHFDPSAFRDFIWRALFAKSLPVEDFELLTTQSYRVMRWPWSLANAIGVASGTLGYALYPRLDTRGFDIMVVETPYPGRVAAGTQMVVRYHDAFPLLMPHTIKDRGIHRAMHYRALARNAADGAWFACVSQATRRELLSIRPELESRAVAIPNTVPYDFRLEDESPDRVGDILWSRNARRDFSKGKGALAPAMGQPRAGLRYLLMVSTIEPRKNHAGLLDAWELLRAQRNPDLHLVIVGGMGWDSEAMLTRFAPWLARGCLHLLEKVPADDLRLLYRHAQVTVCPSFAEGFDYSGVEAMCSGGVVAGSDIPVHREVFGDAAEYFSPYDVRGMAGALGSLLQADAQPRREALRQEGFRVAARYRPEAVLPQWQAFLRQVAQAKPTA
jgi:glycosyltransferase involved in cell wall biosynthesis